MKMLRLNDVIGTNNIFAEMEDNHVLPWSEDDSISSTLLMFEYINNYSGRKITSPAVDNNLGDDNKLTTAGFETLCDVAYMMYAKKWARNWAVLTAEYDPIENYSMIENEETNYGKTSTLSGTDSLQMTGTDTHAHTGSDTTTHSGSHTNTRTGSESNVKTGSHSDAHTGTLTDKGTNGEENQVSAFNSSSYQDATKSSGTVGNTRTFNDTVQTTYNNETDTHNYTNVQDTTSYNNEAETLQHGHTDTETRNMTDATTYGKRDTASGKDDRTLTRSGNIGVTTSQQMLQSDIDLWKWNFFYEVFSDIDSVFTISTY